MKSAWLSPETLPASLLSTLTTSRLAACAWDRLCKVSRNRYRGFWAKFGQQQAHFLLQILSICSRVVLRVELLKHWELNQRESDIKA